MATTIERDGLHYQIVGNHLSSIELELRARQIGSLMGDIQRDVYEAPISLGGQGLVRTDTDPRPDENTAAQINGRITRFASSRELWIAALAVDGEQKQGPARQEDGLMGFVWVSMKDPDNGQPFLEVNELNVRSKDQRRKGIGSILLASATGILRNIHEVPDSEPFGLYVMEDSPARHFYATAGFRRAEATKLPAPTTQPSEVYGHAMQELWESTLGEVGNTLAQKETTSLHVPLALLVAQAQK